MSYTPPNIPEKDLFILVGEQRQGPFTLLQVQEKVQAQEIARGTYLWYPGLDNWITIGDLPAFDRRDVPSPPSGPKQGSSSDQRWSYENGRIVTHRLEELLDQVRKKSFRRADLVYCEPENKWMRADQHPELVAAFSPTAPPPLAGAPAAQPAAEVKPLIPVTHPPRNWVRIGILATSIALAVWFAVVLSKLF